MLTVFSEGVCLRECFLGGTEVGTHLYIPPQHMLLGTRSVRLHLAAQIVQPLELASDGRSFK